MISKKLLQKIEPGLSFLEALGYSRKASNIDIINIFQKEILKVIPETPNDKLILLLDETFDLKNMHKITFSALESLSTIPSSLMFKLKNNADLMADIPKGLLRRVWESDPIMFKAILGPLVEEYVTNETVIDYHQNMFKAKFANPKSWRKVNQSLQGIVNEIGPNEKLYNFTKEYLNLRYRESYNVLYSALMNDITMGLWERYGPAHLANDNAFQFVQSVDNCIQENKVKSSSLDNVKNYVVSVPEDAEIVSDFAFLCGNPLLKAFLAKVIISRLYQVVKNETLPKKDVALTFLSDFFLFCIESKSVIEKRVESYPENQIELYTVFYPILCHLILDVKFGKIPAVNAVLKQICFQYSVPKYITLSFLISIFYENKFETAANLTDILFNEDCYPFTQDDFINSYHKMIKNKLKEIETLDLKIRLLKPLVFMSYYSLKAHRNCLDIVLLCLKEELIGITPIKDLVSILVYSLKIARKWYCKEW